MHFKAALMINADSAYKTTSFDVYLETGQYKDAIKTARKKSVATHPYTIE